MAPSLPIGLDRHCLAGNNAHWLMERGYKNNSLSDDFMVKKSPCLIGEGVQVCFFSLQLAATVAVTPAEPSY